MPHPLPGPATSVSEADLLNAATPASLPFIFRRLFRQFPNHHPGDALDDQPPFPASASTVTLTSISKRDADRDGLASTSTESSSDGSHFSSRFSSRFSSASSDSAETSLTSAGSFSSTSRQPSPLLKGGFGGGCAVGLVVVVPPKFASEGRGGSTRSIGADKQAGVGAELTCSCQIDGCGLVLDLTDSVTSLSTVGDSGSSHSWGISSFAGSSVGPFFLPSPAMNLASQSSATAVSSSPELKPPENFAVVTPKVYRSSFPKVENFPFLKTLGLKAILTLIQEEYPAENRAFLEQEGIRFFQFSIPGNKEPFVHIPEDKIRLALAVVLNKRNHPLLIHCNKGKHRTGCLVGCLRKMQHWSSTAIFDEYRRYSFPKSRNMDQQFIELFDQSAVWADLDQDNAPPWLDLTK